MKSEKFEQLVTELTKLRLNISKDRRAGYAADDDCLTNFKIMAQVVTQFGLVPPDCPMAHPSGSGIALFHVLHKLQRRGNMMKKKVDLVERRVDTDLDTHNYIDLMLACEQDWQIALTALGSTEMVNYTSLDLED